MRIGNTYIEWHKSPWWGLKRFTNWNFLRLGHLLIARKHSDGTIA